jgi:RNA polymerase sigma-70 factor (ECF subfamily)
MSPEEFKHIIVRQQPAMQRMAEAVLHDAVLAEDAVQEAMIQLWQQRAQLDMERNPEALCITMTKRRSIDLLRKQRPSQPIDQEALAVAETVDDYLEARYQSAMRMVKRLPTLQQKALLLKYEEEKSTEEITKELDISPSNLYTTLSRAYAALREMLRKDS